MVVRLPLVPDVAVVNARGRIGRELRAAPFRRELAAVRRMPNLRGVVVRIDSPGGDAVESEELRVALARVAEDVPVVAYVPRVAASGGYLLASAAHRIVAHKWSIVGSIGVIVLRPNVSGLLDKLGVDVVTRKTGPFKDLGSPFRTPTEADAAKEAELIASIFDGFVDAVAEGRSLARDAVARLATGEVFTGAQACEAGLVDVVGDERAARDAVAELAGGPVRPFAFSLPGEGLRRMFDPAAAVGSVASLLGLPQAASLTSRPLLEWVG